MISPIWLRSRTIPGRDSNASGRRTNSPTKKKEAKSGRHNSSAVKKGGSQSRRVNQSTNISGERSESTGLRKSDIASGNRVHKSAFKSPNRSHKSDAKTGSTALKQPPSNLSKQHSQYIEKRGDIVEKTQHKQSILHRRFDVADTGSKDIRIDGGKRHSWRYGGSESMMSYPHRPLFSSDKSQLSDVLSKYPPYADNKSASHNRRGTSRAHVNVGSSRSMLYRKMTDSITNHTKSHLKHFGLFYVIIFFLISIIYCIYWSGHQIQLNL